MSVTKIQESLHYGGKLKLLYNEASPKLRYQVSHLKPDNTWTQPTVIAGVSSVLSLIPKPYLVDWAGLTSIEKALESLNDENIKEINDFIDKYSKTYGVNRYEALKASRKQFPVVHSMATHHKAKSQEAKDGGTDAHNALEALLLGKEYKTTTKAGENALRSFKTSLIKIKDVKTELPVVSLQYGYAGRFDLLGEIGGKLVLGDFKTNKRDKRYNPSGASLDNFIQMGAYAFAWFEEHGTWPQDLAVINVDKEEGAPAVITYASDFNTDPQEMASVFLSMKGVKDSLGQLDYRYKQVRL